jgi:AMP deaminase
VYKAAGQVRNFQDLLNHLFQPLFEVTIDPSQDPKLYQFLLRVRMVVHLMANHVLL